MTSDPLKRGNNIWRHFVDPADNLVRIWSEQILNDELESWEFNLLREIFVVAQEVLDEPC